MKYRKPAQLYLMPHLTFFLGECPLSLLCQIGALLGKDPSETIVPHETSEFNLRGVIEMVMKQLRSLVVRVKSQH